MKRLFIIISIAILSAFILSPASISAQAEEDCGLTALPLLLFKVRVDGRSKDRAQRPLTDSDFEVSRYQEKFEIDYFREVASDPLGGRVFEIGVVLEGAMVSWVSDRMNVSIKSSRKTWGLKSKVLERRFVEQ